MNDQEQEVFNRRSDELAKARAALDAERAKHNTMARALSQVLLDSLAFEARALRAEKTLATLQESATECPACNSSWDAQERAEEDAFALRAKVVALEGEVACLKREARRPGVAKSGTGDTLKRIADALGHSPLHNVDDLVQTVTALRSAASNVERDNLAKHGRIRELEAEVALWKANDAQARRDWNADREAASKVLDVMGELTEFSTPEEAARDLVEQLQAARAELDALKTSAPAVAPAVDESGEPSAYDAQAPARRVFTEADVSIGDRVVVDWSGKRVEGTVTNTDPGIVDGRANGVPTFRLDWVETRPATVDRHSWSDYGSIVEVVAKAPSPGEIVKVGDRVRFAWPGGDVEGVVDQSWSDDTLHVKYADRHYYTVKRSGILEILPTEAP